MEKKGLKTNGNKNQMTAYMKEHEGYEAEGH